MRKIMTKKTTTDAKKEKLPKGSKVFSTKESAEKASLPTPPLPPTPMPVANPAQLTAQKNPQTNLTRTEEALLSPSEKIIAART